MKRWLLPILLLCFPFALEVNITSSTKLEKNHAYVISAIGLSGSGTVNYISGDSTISENGTYKLAPQVIVYDGTTEFVGTATNFTGCYNDIKYVNSVPSGGCGVIKVNNITSENIKAGVTVSYGLENNTLTQVTGTFTSDANATSGSIIEGYTAYVNGEKVFGSLRNGASLKSGEAGLNSSYPQIPVIYGVAAQSNITTDGQAIWSMSVPSHMYMAPYSSYLSIKQSDLANNIGLSSNKILSGQSVLGISGTATSDANAYSGGILQGLSAYVNGSKVDGSMTNRGNVNVSISPGETYTIPEGYHAGSGTVGVYVPTDLPSADKVLAGTTVWVHGLTWYQGTMPNNGAVSVGLNPGQSYTIPAGYHNGSGSVWANAGGGGVLDYHSTYDDNVWNTYSRTFNQTVSKGTYLVTFQAFQHSCQESYGTITATIGSGSVNQLFDVIHTNTSWGGAGRLYAAVITCTSDSVLNFSVTYPYTGQCGRSFIVAKMS